MSIRVRREGNKVTIETDYPAAGVSHEMVHETRELLGAMSAYGIKEVETRKTYGFTYDLKREFDKKFKEKYGQTYFYPE
jgi:hypothetical protein